MSEPSPPLATEQVFPAKPDLTGRVARCAYHGRRTSPRGSYGGGNECNYGQREHTVCTCEQPSSDKLPFFEYCGPGSRESDEICKHCHYHKVAHEKKDRPRQVCGGFEPQGDRGFDKFFCGCQGWD